jgi:hypothetical protein
MRNKELARIYKDKFPDITDAGELARLIVLDYPEKHLEAVRSAVKRIGIAGKRTRKQEANSLNTAQGMDILDSLATEYPLPASQPLRLVKPNVGFRPKLPKPYLNGNPKNKIIIGDTHEPFCRAGYLEFCREVQERFNCGTVIHIGDLIDVHYSSFHDSDPDGFGAGEELDRAIYKVSRWYKVFPEVKVCIGNHDAIIQRKAFASGLSSRWIKGFGEVLHTPNWEYEMEYEIGNNLYTHTLGGNLLNAAMARRQSLICGHLHTVAGVQWNVNKESKLFAMQVGTGINDKAYAFAYAKLVAKKSILSCGVILDDEIPFVVPMSL